MRTLMVGIALLSVACGGAETEPQAPPIAVNQRGLSERLVRVSSDQEAAPTAPTSSESEPATAIEKVESPSQPEPESSGRRVAFRPAGDTSATQPQTKREPSEGLRPDRDPRRVRFDARHEERLRRVARE